MNFDLSSEQKLIFESAVAFGRAEIKPNATTWEKNNEIPRAFLKKAAAMGFSALYVDEIDGGAGLSRLDSSMIFEALAMSCPSVSAFISIHNMCAWMIATYGTNSVKSSYMKDIVSMNKICSYCLTEPDAGSDSSSIKTLAKKVKHGYCINGTKAFISGAGFSDIYLTMCKTKDVASKSISAFLVTKSSAGISFGRNENKMGWKAQPTAQVRFDNCVIDDTCLLGKEHSGFKYAMKALDSGRLNIAAASLGGAQNAFDIALDYIKQRSAFGNKLSSFQSLQFKLADMETKLQVSRIFLRQAAWKIDHKSHDASVHCAMTKRFVTDVSFEVANEALQLLGGYGYLEEYSIEKIVRDLRVHQILEGTNEIMRVIISRSLINERG